MTDWLAFAAALIGVLWSGSLLFEWWVGRNE